MNQPDAQTAPNYVTCPCEHCSGNIEFDSNQLDGTENVTVPCPHCGLETKIFVPEQSMPPVISDDTPQPAQSDEFEKTESQPAETPQKPQPVQRSAEVQGSIGYFGLADWWINNLSEMERARIISLYDSRQAKTLIEGTISRESMWASRSPMGEAYHSSGLGFQLGINCVDYLIKMVNFKLNPEKAGYGMHVMTATIMKATKDFGLRVKIIQKIIEEVNKPDTEAIDKHIAYSFLAMIFYSERKIDSFAVQRAIWACLKQIEISPQIKPLMRTPTRLTQEDFRRLLQEARKSGKSDWKYCLDQNIFRANSIVRDRDIPPYDSGFRYLLGIFQNEKQNDRLVALCDKAIEQGWEGAFWKDTLTKNRVYLGDENPASEWLPALPELKWDETFLNVPPTIPAPQEIKPQSDVPSYDMDFVTTVFCDLKKDEAGKVKLNVNRQTSGLKEMNQEQKAFYLKLVDSIKNKTYLPVEDQTGYLNYYIREKYTKFDRDNLERLYEELLSLAVPYPKVGSGNTWLPIYWTYDCLLELELYDKYFEATKPPNIFLGKPFKANERCNVRYYLGLPASSVDLLNIYGERLAKLTSFTKQHPAKFEQILEAVFAEDERKNDSWFDRILAGSDRINYRPYAFICHHKIHPKIPTYSFDHASEEITKHICGAIREAENRLRDALGEKRVGENWDDETKLFHTIKEMFPELQVIHHGKPDWLGRMHLDIWIPDLKIAIEYHGPQHFEEMKHFGGAESLEATKKRDALKRSACARKGVRLFEVLSLDEVPQAINEIRQAAQKKGYVNTVQNLELPF
jgi:hypothetical protein